MFLSLQDQQFLASYKRTQDLENDLLDAMDVELTLIFNQ